MVTLNERRDRWCCPRKGVMRRIPQHGRITRGIERRVPLIMVPGDGYGFGCPRVKGRTTPIRCQLLGRGLPPRLRECRKPQGKASAIAAGARAGGLAGSRSWIRLSRRRRKRAPPAVRVAIGFVGSLLRGSRRVRPSGIILERPLRPTLRWVRRKCSTSQHWGRPWRTELTFPLPRRSGIQADTLRRYVSA